MAKDRLSRKDKRLYDKHLRDIKKLDPEVDIILDVTEDDSDWLRQPPRRESEARD